MSDSIDTVKIQDDINYFMSKVNVGASFFDARCFQIMNDNFGLKPLFDEVKPKTCDGCMHHFIGTGYEFSMNCRTCTRNKTDKYELREQS